jgi:hypothetical protein
MGQLFSQVIEVKGFLAAENRGRARSPAGNDPAGRELRGRAWMAHAPAIQVTRRNHRIVLGGPVLGGPVLGGPAHRT